MLNGEKFSNHPIAKSILKKLDYEVDTKGVNRYKEVSGKGIEYILNGDKIQIGNHDFVEAEDSNEQIENATIIYLKKNQEIIRKHCCKRRSETRSQRSYFKFK